MALNLPNYQRETHNKLKRNIKRAFTKDVLNENDIQQVKKEVTENLARKKR